jgi:uncharacterized protein (DUF736 family)
MKIGEFRAAENGGYIGELDALGLSVEAMTFWPVIEKQGDGPDFLITTPGDVSDDPFVTHIPSYDIGAAWKKIGKNGKPYLSVKLDGPTLAAPIDCRLIERKNGSFSLIWNRKEEEATGTVEHQAAA